jgi:hypothetical protein
VTNARALLRRVARSAGGGARTAAPHCDIVALGVVFALARFSEAFLVLRAQDAGLPIAWVPAVMIVMNVIYAGVAAPAGHAADMMSARTLLVAGLVKSVVADVALAAATAPWFVLPAPRPEARTSASTQGLFSKLVADTAPAHARGERPSASSTRERMAMLLASVIAGVMWSAAGPGRDVRRRRSFAADRDGRAAGWHTGRPGDARPA